MNRNILYGVFVAILIVLSFRYCEFKDDDYQRLEEHSALIEKTIKNVGKLVVTEGEYAEVFTYEDSKDFYLDILTATKKALVVANAKATISYDLSKVETQIDEATQTVYITHIPKPELTINPNLEYYDIQQDLFNPFEAEDYNVIKSRVTNTLREKIEASSLYTNAENRLITELHKIYILTNSLGWTLQYETTPITGISDFEELLD
ncbi:hypothetical protein GCM10011344_19770 [Dokdonia pacifica]|uniref:DUF4230 domain-containing protein n=1 Tax=Dokdonia pacifica TaxID=1627892 RepID=A0A238VPU2_9FLAO|nr:DUF4230 domain-containing protein [Dokdonia pacifica]GGG19211.1 hypothetical protein GCM10011344_19770 [Dokdonia pacifica]SNR36228.1 Protein of unknown function [Dokdonia pacifica]